MIPKLYLLSPKGLHFKSDVLPFHGCPKRGLKDNKVPLPTWNVSEIRREIEDTMILSFGHILERT